MTLENKIVLVTGGGSGIGYQASLLLAENGATVIVSDINVENGEETAQAILDHGGTGNFIKCDVANHDNVASLMQAIINEYGRLDCAVNNAGIAGDMRQYIQVMDEEHFDRIINVNLKGVWLCLKHEITHMLERRSGSIVNIASVAGLIGVPGGSAYGASKHGVIGLTKAIALEVASKGIRVNAVCPSFVETPMVTTITEQDERMARTIPVASPMRRLGQPEEIAEAIVWLCSDKSSFVNGACLTLDGGLTAM